MHELKRQSLLPSHSLSDRFTPGTALRKRWANRDPKVDHGRIGYKDRLLESYDYWLDSWKRVFENGKISNDVLAGITVAAVALPLNVALAVACGLPASSGIIAGAVGGALAAIFGGATLQVTGPAAALNVLVFAMVAKWGPMGAFAGALAVGLMQIVLFFTRASTLMRFVPEAVLVGFTTGVGLKLLDQQIPLLLDVEHPVSYLFKTLSNPIWLNDVHWMAVLLGLIVMIFMLSLSKHPKIPAAILGLTLATGISAYLNWDVHRVGAIPAQLPKIMLPSLEGINVLELILAALPLAILATAESLLSAQAVDRMRGPQNKHLHDPNLETIGQGLANVGAGLFGGMTVSGVIVRSSVNVQSGAKTRLASLFHALLLLAAPLFAAQWISIIPIAALAGLLCLIGYRLVEIKTFVHVFKENKLEAVAFVVAAAGVVSGQLTFGLITAMIICGVSAYWEKSKKKKKAIKTEKPKLPPGVRAKVGKAKTIDVFAKAQPIAFRMPEENWEAHIQHTPVVHPTAFVHPNASLIGNVVLGPNVHVATEAALRADEGTPFYIGANTNIQDGVVLHALKSQWVEVEGKKWAIYVGDNVSMAHQSLVHGPAYVGNRTFIGFKSIVHNSVVGNDCFIGLGAIVVGVEIPDGKHVPHGMLVDTQEKAMALPAADHGQHHFNEDVVGVNIGLASAYRGEWMKPGPGRCC